MAAYSQDTPDNAPENRANMRTPTCKSNNEPAFNSAGRTKRCNNMPLNVSNTTMMILA
ncbi:hypothetical protein D3C80_1891110 [compost metagenome]